MNRWSRRRFLQGIGGVTLALPLFESLMGSKAYAQATQARRFFVVVRAGNGIVQQSSEGPDRFWPSNTGAITREQLTGMDSGRAVSVLSAYASRLLLVKNVRLPFARNSCGHAEALPQLLTAQNHTGGSANNPKALGRSVDWYLAEKLNAAGVGPLTFMAGPTGAYIGEGLSWSAPQMRTPAERSPGNAFTRLTGVSGAPPEVQQLIANRRKSVNDLVRAQLNDLKGQAQLSTFDRQRLDQHLTSVRDMELTMECNLAADQETKAKSFSNPQANDVRPEVVKSFMDLTAWAFNCGLNHVATLQVGEGNDQTQYTINGSKLPRFHHISHRINSDGSEGEPIPNAVDLHHQIDRMHLELFRHLLDRLDSYATPNGTLLDDSLATWVNDLGSGPPHSADNVPFVMAGKAGGSVNTGRVIDHQKKNVNQVLNGIINAMGVRKTDGSQVDDFGDASLAKGVVAGMMV